MAFFMLFQVPKTFTVEQLKKDCCRFGTLGFCKLTPDNKNPDIFFGQIDFIELHQEKKFIEYLKANHIGYKQKESNKTSQKNICHNQSNRGHQEKREIVANTERSRLKVIQIANPSFFYYKDEAFGKEIEKFTFNKGFESLFKIDKAKSFELTTTYPGLLIGAGYNHPIPKDSSDKNEQYRLGFFFDHTTGLPIISGSSIKGVLRSLFPKDQDSKEIKTQKIDLLKTLYGIDEDIMTLRNKFFESGKTVFYDAYILETDANNKGKIFGSDYITSHYSDEELGAFKNPNPVKFLKILPGVTFQFQFKADKDAIELFEKILFDIGVGAKTNVGYGQFK